MDQPNSTNPQAEPSLDDDVESLLASVKSTQVEAPAERAEDGDADGTDADEAVAERAIASKVAKGMVASDDAGDIADILNAQHDEATHEREVNANGVEPLAGAPKINGDTAAIDAQLDVLTRQAAELAEMAEVEGAEAEAAGAEAEAAGAADATSLASQAASVEANTDEGVDVASLMDAVAAEVGGASAPEPSNAGTLPTSVEDAAELAAKMLASATAAVQEVTGTSPAAVDTPANAEADADPPNELGDARGENADVADPAAALDDLLANLDEPPALQTPDEPVASVEADAAAGFGASQVEAETMAATPAAPAFGSASASAAAYGSASASAATAASNQAPIKTIQSLDDQIAQLSEDLLNQPSQADALLPSQAAMAAPAAKPAPVEPVAPAPVREAVAKAAPVPAAPVQAAPVQAEPIHAAHAHAAPVHNAPAKSEHRAASAGDVETAIAPAKPKVSLRQRLAPVFTGVVALLGSAVGVATPLLAVLSAPLAKKPRIVRDSVGWIAVNTVFCASCLWGYMLFLRPDQVAEQHAAFDLAHAELPEVPAHAGGHDAHGAADDHGGGHEAPKDDGHGAKKDDGHGAKKDDGHGGAAKGGAKKEAYKPPSRKPPTKADRAKAKPKDDGHGGGGGGH